MLRYKNPRDTEKEIFLTNHEQKIVDFGNDDFNSKISAREDLSDVSSIIQGLGLISLGYNPDGIKQSYFGEQ
jgi:hypothetical protein